MIFGEAKEDRLVLTIRHKMHLPVLNGWVTIAGSFTAEITSLCGFDCMTIDLQYGCTSCCRLLQVRHPGSSPCSPTSLGLTR